MGRPAVGGVSRRPAVFQGKENLLWNLDVWRRQRRAQAGRGVGEDTTEWTRAVDIMRNDDALVWLVEPHGHGCADASLEFHAS